SLSTLMASSAKVQHVPKASSDELLRKFAELESESCSKGSIKRDLQLAKRQKRNQTKHENSDDNKECPLSSKTGNRLVERKSLLPARSSRKSASLRQFGKEKTREVRSKSFLGTIEKTWRKTVEGASRVFMEKHYNRHKRLNNIV
ncbi:hypothetical protein GIB67_023220, partial [Kingdonia uniflora]